VNVVKHQCCCGWKDCAELAAAHEYGDFTHQLPVDPDECRSYLFGLGVPEDEHDEIVRRRCEEHEDIRYRHLHHYRCNRTFTHSGMPALVAETQHAHQQVRGKKIAPLPDRPRGGQDGVINSPAKHANPADAARVSAARKKQRRSGASPEFKPEEVQGTAVQPPAAKVTNRAAHGYANPDDGRGIDPVAYKPGTFLCTIPQVITLIQLIDTHARECTGTISWRTRDCTFIGVVGSMGGNCSKCGSWHRWYSSPRCKATAAVTEEGAEMEEEGGTDPFFLNEVICQAVGQRRNWIFSTAPSAAYTTVRVAASKQPAAGCSCHGRSHGEILRSHTR